MISCDNFWMFIIFENVDVNIPLTKRVW